VVEFVRRPWVHGPAGPVETRQLGQGGIVRGLNLEVLAEREPVGGIQSPGHPLYLGLIRGEDV